MSYLTRVAGAPISWGVCEVPGWGYQMSPDRVLAEMRQVGIAATEFGPDGFLPTAAQERADLLKSHDLVPVGGFVPAVLHVDGRDPVAELAPTFATFADVGSRTVVLAADSGRVGYDERAELDDAAWRRLCANLDALVAAAADHGLTVTLHPHVGTVVESATDVRRVLDGSDVPLCLDTGHLMIGGTDPAELARAVPDRVAHVHLKDVDAARAEKVASGAATYTAMVADGIYRPLGQGDVDVAGIVGALEGAGYRGWYVMEQDTVLDAEPAAGAGPVADVGASIDFLRGLGTADD
jgi:inosose dehydratase